MRKRIAVLVAQIDETTQKRFLTEFISRAYSYDYDVCIFSMYQKYQETNPRNVGDSNIFNLINYKLFDAVVVLADTILTPGLSLKLQNKIREDFSGPVIVVDEESPFFESIMMDHYTPMLRIVNHLIEVHGYKRIAFLGGKEGHPHSVQRLEAYIDSMKMHGNEIDEELIYHGNYWYDSAEDFVERLLKKSDELPEAIVCANDHMAIGAATRLTEKGYRIPEDIAITGYDSIHDGRTGPSPLTSADVPAGECGDYCMQWLHAKISHSHQESFDTKAPIFIGGSCGCEYKIEMVPKSLRRQWKTHQSSRGVFSDFNHIIEDLLAQNDLEGFLKIVSEYVYQLRPFDGFSICMNKGFLSPDTFVGENAIRKGYSSEVYRVLNCGKGIDDTTIDFESSFKVSDVLPELYEEREYPTTFIFNPIYFDDKCFGYTALCYGKEVKTYDESYRIWMRNVMQGMEAYYRQSYMFSLIDRIKADQVRDPLTGLYNYEGFLKKTNSVIESEDSNRKVNILTIDIKGMKPINEIYGRDCGEKAIRDVARFIQNAANSDEICCRMCNDEFLIAILGDDDSSRTDALIESIQKSISEYRLLEDTDYQMQIHFANMVGNPTSQGELELLVNRVISIKNHKKHIMLQNVSTETEDVVADIERNQLVMHILNENLLTYYYQPIVKVSDGSIFAYEALMRYEKSRITPVQIIQSATYLNRLPDIEKWTLLDVTRDVENNLHLFNNAKVFVNSLPGIELSEEDDKTFSDRMIRNKGRFVIEFTEESEPDDEKLEALKKKYKVLGNQIAVDDYGAGYSNVNNLLRYSPQYVKIDRMLITELHNNLQKQHMVKSIIDYAHNNNIVALAEGIETKEEMQECIRLGVDLLQGYYTGKAARVPVDSIDEKIKNEIERVYSNKSWAV